MRILTASEIREVDRHAEAVLRVPTAWLMENAGRAVAEAVLSLAPRRVFVACGKGNNGGDGYVAARHLRAVGLEVSIAALVREGELKGDARANARAAAACGVREGDPAQAGEGDVVVDAVFGTGLTRAPTGEAHELLRAVQEARRRGARIVAVDLPSGLDADKPHPPGDAVQADVTVALHALKPAHVQYPARGLCGEIRLGMLGIPASHLPGPERILLSRGEVASLLPRRAPDAHKGTNGHVLVIAGSPGKSGAAMLACRAALRAGAGLVTLASDPEVVDRVLPAMPEVMAHPLPSRAPEVLREAMAGKDALVVGPGIPRDPTTGPALAELLSSEDVAACLDADALNALAESAEAQQLVRRAKRPPVLTPHPAELARLLGSTTREVQADRFAAATEAARRFNAFVVLKGAMSVLAEPSGALAVCPTGGPWLATAGTGDVLAGACGGLLAQGIAPAAAMRVSAWVHGRAGDLAAGGRTRGLLAGDVVERLPDALAELG